MARGIGTVGVASGAVGLSGFAAALGLCCTVPWAVTLLGVSGAIAFARLSFLLPYAVVGSVLMIGLGFWSVYGRGRSRDGSACAMRPQHARRAIVWVAAILVGVLSVIALTFRVTV